MLPPTFSVGVFRLYLARRQIKRTGDGRLCFLEVRAKPSAQLGIDHHMELAERPPGNYERKPPDRRTRKLTSFRSNPESEAQIRLPHGLRRRALSLRQLELDTTAKARPVPQASR